MGADLQGHEEEGSQPPPVLRPYTVRVRFDPYSHNEAQQTIKNARRDFPKWTDKDRWNYTVPDIDEPNVWVLDFHFRDIEDAMIFGLKYVR